MYSAAAPCQAAAGQSTSLRSLAGSPCTRLRWVVARSKATRTALRTLELRPSIIFSLSMVSSMPSGTILDFGSHCLSKAKTGSEASSRHRIRGAPAPPSGPSGQEAPRKSPASTEAAGRPGATGQGVRPDPQGAGGSGRHTQQASPPLLRTTARRPAVPLPPTRARGGTQHAQGHTQRRTYVSLVRRGPGGTAAGQGGPGATGTQQVVALAQVPGRVREGGAGRHGHPSARLAHPVQAHAPRRWLTPSRLGHRQGRGAGDRGAAARPRGPALASVRVGSREPSAGARGGASQQSAGACEPTGALVGRRLTSFSCCRKRGRGRASRRPWSACARLSSARPAAGPGW